MKNLSIAALLFFSTHTVFADSPTCYQKSPYYDEVGEKYFDLDHSLDLSRETEKALSKIVDSLNGEWVGRVVELGCSGPDRAPRKKETTSTALADITITGKGVIRIAVNKTDTQDGVERREILDLLINGAIYRLNVTKGVLSIGEKLRFPNRLTEFISIIELNGSRLLIEVSNFTNGVFVHRQTISLTRKK